MTNWNKRHHYKQSSEYPNECICGLPFGNPLHIQPKQPKLKQSMKLKTSMEVEEILFELHTRFCPLVDTEDNPIKQRHCNMVKNELRKAINSEIDKAREEVLTEVGEILGNNEMWSGETVNEQIKMRARNQLRSELRLKIRNELKSLKQK